MFRKVLLAALATIAIFMSSNAAKASPKDIALNPDAAGWAKAHFRKGVLPPFSFKYGGVSSDSFLKKWKCTTAADGNGNTVVTYRDPSTGLEVICLLEVFSDFDAVEWTISLKNASGKDTPVISEFNAADFKLVPIKGRTGFTLNHINGSLAATDDFAPHYDTLEEGAEVTFGPQDGRSSSGPFPFFNILSGQDGNEGVVMSVGWSGHWKAGFLRTGESGREKLSVKAGPGRFNAYLKPGEKVRMQKISLMFWDGGDGPRNMAGNNKFRRFILSHHSRKIGGKTAMYPLCGGLNWGDPAPLNEYTGMTGEYAKFLVDRYFDFDIRPDAIWLDAGWYEDAADWRNGRHWSNSVGTWREDAKRFPKTLRDVTDHIHSLGYKMMVWFEPERVVAGSEIFREHRGWLLEKPGDKDTYLFNLADPEACAWLAKYIGDFLESRGIDYYRQDFNMDPSAYWEAADSPGREGITEAHYIEGLYAYWDALLERFPGLLIDNCASGGRRLDIETAGRSAPLWRTDYAYGEVNGYQNQTYGLSWFLPMNGTGVYTTDTYGSRSAYSSAMVMNYKLTDHHFSFLEMKRVQDEYRMIQPYYLEDFYPLSGISDIASLKRWIVYQLHRKSDDSSFVLAFRRPESPDDAFKACLKGLSPDKEYIVRNMDSKEEITLPGKALMDGFTISLPTPRSCALWHIQEK